MAYPHADRVEQGVLVYEAVSVRPLLADAAAADALRAELADALADGPGIVVLAGAFDPDVVDRLTGVFERVIADEKAAGSDRRRPLREAGRERPGVERPGEGSPSPTPRPSSRTTPTTCWLSRRRPGSAPATR